MKKTLAVAVIALAAGACSGGHQVVSVDGAGFSVDDIPITTESSTVDLGTFRNALNWLIRDEVLMNAAEREFGVTFTEAEVTEWAESALASLPEDQLEDPRANLDYFIIQARVGLQGLLWPIVEPELPEGTSQNDWAIEQLNAAEVEVDVRYGVWRLDPEPLVYEQ
jgi:hypothetical protein